MTDLLGKRLVIVTGKGGVGKTTVAAALGLLAARAGRRTLVCEVAEQERITEVFGRPPAGFTETEVAESLHTFSINPEDAKQEWLRHQLHSSRLAGLLNQSRIFQYLTAAAPGLAEVVTIGKVWELAQLERRTPRSAPYDLVVVDAPATGNGLALLRSPRTYRDIARVGPIAKHAAMIDGFLSDTRQTAVVAVALAEEMPVNETIELEQRLASELGMKLALVLANGVLPERFSGDEAEAMKSVDGAGSPAAREALAAALAAHERSRSQRSQLERLRRETTAPVAALPLILVPELDLDGLQQLSRELEKKL
ncbi:MAG: ArsA family ATPase [Thermoleophilaceae bacterium]